LKTDDFIPMIFFSSETLHFQQAMKVRAAWFTHVKVAYDLY
jgi:hypothetical protein